MNNIIEKIADKLNLRHQAVKKWATTNDYNLDQLTILNKQIAENSIYIPTLTDAIVNNMKYQISIY